MGTYHTLFVAKDDDLDRLFPGWKRVSPNSPVVETKNPFTGELTKVVDWRPVERPTALGSPSLRDDVWGPPLPPIVPPENEYMAGLEEACAPGLRALPHVCLKNFEPLLELEPLVRALLGRSEPVPPIRLGSDADTEIPYLAALPKEAARALAGTADADLPAVLARLLADPDFTGDAEEDDTRGYYERGLVASKALAVEATRTDGWLCHLYTL